MVFYDNRKISAPPPDEVSGKHFLGIFKKNIVQTNVAEKKIIASSWGMKKNSCTKKLPNPPPPQISNGPSLRQALNRCKLLCKDEQYRQSSLVFLRK